jgi:hypothetical protein
LTERNFRHGLERVFLCIVYNAISFVDAGDATKPKPIQLGV